jgi:hypothetical protein
MKARYLILITTLAFLGFSVTAVADRCLDYDEDHKHCVQEPEPDPLTLPVCDKSQPQPEYNFCIASVGKWHRQAARDYAADYQGSYTEIHSGDFDNILAALSEEVDFSQLCAAYDVLIFEWNSTNMSNLTWLSLVDYMECGGGIIFEDTTNVTDLSPDVTIEEINVHDRRKSPLTIAFDEDCVSSDPGIDINLCSGLPDVFDVINNHIVFDDGHQLPDPLSNPFLMPFLRLPSSNNDGAILGLYGEFRGGENAPGRIVLTGPDNSYHGSELDPPDDTDPKSIAKLNQYLLLFHEIDWLLEVK